MSDRDLKGTFLLQISIIPPLRQVNYEPTVFFRVCDLKLPCLLTWLSRRKGKRAAMTDLVPLRAVITSALQRKIHNHGEPNCIHAFSTTNFFSSRCPPRLNQ